MFVCVCVYVCVCVCVCVCLPGGKRMPGRIFDDLSTLQSVPISCSLF